MNLVILKHGNNDGRQFLFGVPEGKRLSAGDKVLVENKNGRVDGTCQCDSFDAPENVAKALIQTFGGKLPLAMVVGRYALEKWDDTELPY